MSLFLRFLLPKPSNPDSEQVVKFLDAQKPPFKHAQMTIYLFNLYKRVKRWC